ncbi:MAG: carboxypeptidase regulatory-like domain-containing protein [Myxococcota bacterium]|nr:carboxypeptidase regulatory-like domain-containing protein [Myxococcota bacterium]
MRWGIVLALVIAVLAIAWRCGSDKSPQVRERSVASVARGKKIDRSVRGSIVGTVTDGAVPLAGALVCIEARAELLDPPCVASDAGGAFTFGALAPDRYRLVASLATFRPARSDEVVLRGTEAATVALVLSRGGVEITGTVADLNGGPIAKARVTARNAVGVTRDDGSFTLWAAPGEQTVVGSAEGYASSREGTYAPGHVELLLIPEGTISGTVVDAITGEPVADVRVRADGSENHSDGVAITDAQGAFRVTRLTAGRYAVNARTERGYGLSEGSVLLGVGGNVSGIVVKLHLAALVTATVTVSSTRQPCAEPSARLHDVAKDRRLEMSRASEGTLVAEGTLVGTYAVEVSCKGFLRRDSYAPLVVGSSDVVAAWEVDPGGRIVGHVRTESGAPVANVLVSAMQTGEGWYWRYDTTGDDGRFEIPGLRAGTYELKERLLSEYVGTKTDVVVATGATIERDLVIPETGDVRGQVVDEGGKPIAGVGISLEFDANRPLDVYRKTDANGHFVIDRVLPHEYSVEARHSRISKPVRSERITVRAKQTTNVKIVLRQDTGSISGVVTDPSGKPVGDAFITLADDKLGPYAKREALSGTWSTHRPILTAPDGTFTATNLPHHTYAIRAHRKGAGDGVVENIPIGATAKIQLRRTGSIAGNVRSWNSALDELSITVRDTSGFQRFENFFRTKGSFAIDDVPGGHLTITAGAEGREATVEVDLADGERKTDVVIELLSLVTITGRAVDHHTRKPIAKVTMAARPVRGQSARFSLPYDESDSSYISDENGRFTINRAPLGKLVLTARAHDGNETYAVRSVAGTNVVDVGDILVVVTANELSGESGLDFVDNEDYLQVDRWQVVVKSVAANGPGALAGIKAGDVVTSINGIDMRGFGSMNLWRLLSAPPGTTLAFTLARGVTVNITLTKRP